MDYTNVTKQFLERLQWDGVTEISDLTHNLWWLDKYDDIIHLKKDLYFISFLPSYEWYETKEKTGKAPRTKNSHVKWINYLKCDFDIRRCIYEKDNRIIDEEELLSLKDKLLDWLKQDSLLGSYSAVIHSGNGIHIYWIGETIEISSKNYAAVSTELYNRIKKLFPDNPELWPDYACWNIGRLLRLPGSMNYKACFGLPPHEVELLEYNTENSQLFASLWSYVSLIWNNMTRTMDAVKDVFDLGRMTNVTWDVWLVVNWQDTFQKINTIDIAELVCEYTGWRMAPDGINFISSKDWCHTGAYIIPDENVVVHVWTPHFSDYYKVYSPFAFLMVHYANNDVKRTFEIAKEKFPRLNDEEDLFYWLVKNGVK